MTSDTFCILPFISLASESDGNFKVCCMSEFRIPHNGVSPENYEDIENFITLDKNVIEDAWDSDLIKEIRQSLLDGVKHKNCDLCWKEEAVGRPSKRVRDNHTYRDIIADELDLKQPLVLDLKLGNTCNIKCRTCGTHSSSKWAQEEIDVFHKDDEIAILNLRNRLKRSRDSYADENAVWDTLNNWLPEVIHFDFYGGEPMLIDKQWNLVERSVANGYSVNQKVHYNTNGTLYIDGIEDQFNYIRHPAKWDEVLKNIESYKTHVHEGSGVNLGVCMTISPFNVYYIDDLSNFFEGQLGLPVYLNLVHWPAHQNCQNIPDHVKHIVEEKVRNNLTYDSASSAFSWLDNIMKFMHAESCDEELYAKFVNTTKIHDKYRNESFSKTFSEFANLLGID